MRYWPLPLPLVLVKLRTKFNTKSSAINARNSAVRAIQWKPEPHLQRNIDLYKTQHDQFAALLHQKNEQGLVQFWLDMALNNSPSKYNWEPENRIQKAWEHLSLYCEESCYRAASKVWKENQYKCWEEYIFFARCLVKVIYQLAQFFLIYIAVGNYYMN